MRVLTVVTEAPPVRSGIAAVTGRITNGLRDLGHEVDAITTDDVGRVNLGEFRLTGLPRRWRSIRSSLDEYDVVHLHGPAPTFSDAFLGLWRTVPRRQRPGLVYTHHSDIDLQGLRPFCAVYNRLHRRLTRAASHVVVSTPSYQRIAVPGRRGRVEVIPFGVEAPRHVAERPRGPMTVAFIGQLRPYKGIDVLIRAAAMLPDVTVHVAGTGYQEASLRQLAARLGAANVVFHGAVEDWQRSVLLRRADVVCLPSRTRAEAFGLVLLEGMRAGAVPVAADLPGVRDVAGSTGLLVQPGSVQSLVQALCHLRDNPADRRRRSAAAVAAARGYTWDGTVRDYHRVLADAALVPHLRRGAPQRLDSAMSLMREAALAERASLLLLDDREESLRLVSVWGQPLPGPGAEPEVELGSFAGRALLTGKAYVVSEAAGPLGELRQPEAHAGLCVPFDSGGMRGVVSFTRLRPFDFLPAEVDWMSQRVEHLVGRALRHRKPEEPSSVEAIA